MRTSAIRRRKCRTLRPEANRAAPAWEWAAFGLLLALACLSRVAGFFLVGDGEDDALGLPGGDRELPLMIADRSFDADGHASVVGSNSAAPTSAAFASGATTRIARRIARLRSCANSRSPGWRSGCCSAR